MYVVLHTVTSSTVLMSANTYGIFLTLDAARASAKRLLGENVITWYTDTWADSYDKVHSVRTTIHINRHDVISEIE